MSAFTMNIHLTVSDPETFLAAWKAGRVAHDDSDIATMHTAHLTEDGSKAIFVDEHDSTETLQAYLELMSGTHDGIYASSEVVEVIVTGEPDEVAMEMLGNFPHTVYRTLGGS